jgi:tetratricopeptide (TPR) repeat protein
LAERESTAARTATFWAIALAVPFVVLGIVELALRLGGFGHDLEPLFIESPQQPGFLQANPRVVTRFFTDPAQAPSVSIETAYFRASKPAGSFRVFVQGESSAAGFPYGLGAALAGVLDQRLERAFPSREIEVISTAMAAVNSYALLDFADEIIAQQPDAVVIYVGHNEYLGILGVGSTLKLASSPRLTRSFLGVREWRLFQALARLYGNFQGAGPSSQTTTADDSLMARVAGERSITLVSPLFGSGVEQFRVNLEALLAKYSAAGIPVFIGTLVSNERDQPPLAKLGGAETEAAGAAETAYYAAQDAEQAGSLDEARKGYAWARDLDPLRFRAPSVFNEVISGAARAAGATLVDVHQAFVTGSADGLVGNSLLLEHVHPNLDGYYLLADAFFDAMVERGLPGQVEATVPDEVARTEMPVSEIDRWLGEYKVLKVKSAWPFRPASVAPVLPEPRTEGERLAMEVYREQLSWPEAQDRLRRHYKSIGDTREFTRVTAILADAFPFAAGLQFEMAATLIEVERPADALRYARRAVDLAPNDVNHLLVQAHAQALTGRRDEARNTLERVLVLEPGNVTAARVLGQLSESR